MFGYPRRTMAGLVCIYYGNTGSTWLIQLLGASPQVLIPGFERIEGWAWDAPAGERVDWLRTALMPPANRDGDTYDVWVTVLQASPQVMEALNSKPNFEHVGFKMNGLAVLFTRDVADVLQGDECEGHHPHPGEPDQTCPFPLPLPRGEKEPIRGRWGETTEQGSFAGLPSLGQGVTAFPH